MTTEANPQTSAEVPDGAQTANATAPEDSLGDGGKRALATLRDEVRSLKAQLKQYQAPEPASDAARDASEEADSTSESARDAAPTSDAIPGDPGGNVKPTPPKFEGSADGGAAGRSSVPGARQLSANDLRSMGPRAVEKARRAGQLRDLLSGR